MKAVAAALQGTTQTGPKCAICDQTGHKSIRCFFNPEIQNNILIPKFIEGIMLNNLTTSVTKPKSTSPTPASPK